MAEMYQKLFDRELSTEYPARDGFDAPQKPWVLGVNPKTQNPKPKTSFGFGFIFLVYTQKPKTQAISGKYM